MITRKPVYYWYCNVHHAWERYYVSIHNATIRQCAARPTWPHVPMLKTRSKPILWDGDVIIEND